MTEKIEIYSYTVRTGEQVPEQRRLSKTEVHTWFFSLCADQSAVTSMRHLLTADECQRADRYRLAELARRFTLARGMQRKILSAYCGVRPEYMYFDYSATGKPFLPGSSIQFNLSHSGDYGMLAVAIHRQVGIDIEYIRPVSVRSIAKRYFIQEEIDCLVSLSEDQRQKTFFRIWTCKEAYVKARGLALSDALSDVSVAVPLNEDTQSVRVKKEKVEGWMVYELQPTENTVAALVVEK
jgi:4'-phosphopantetheinyl transferase